MDKKSQTYGAPLLYLFKMNWKPHCILTLCSLMLKIPTTSGIDKGVPSLVSTRCSLGIYKTTQREFDSLLHILYYLFLIFSSVVSCVLCVWKSLYRMCLVALIIATAARLFFPLILIHSIFIDLTLGAVALLAHWLITGFVGLVHCLWHWIFLIELLLHHVQFCFPQLKKREMNCWERGLLLL